MTIRAALFDLDGTLVADVPSRSPRHVRTMPHAREVLDALRSHRLNIGVVTNQPLLADGRVTPARLAARHRRVESLLGRIDGWFVCPHAASAGCRCRKPQPGLILDACRCFGIEPEDCVVVGDIGSDVLAAQRAGARSVLVPTAVTRRSEVIAAPCVRCSLLEVAQWVLA